VIFISAVAFAIAVLMYGFSLASGHVTWTLFALVGLLFLALASCPWGWVVARRTPPGQP
jgi:hypothetical protein